MSEALAPDEVLAVQEEGIAVDPDAIAFLVVRIDCGNGVSRYMSTRGAEDLARALLLAVKAAETGQEIRS